MDDTPEKPPSAKLVSAAIEALVRYGEATSRADDLEWMKGVRTADDLKSRIVDEDGRTLRFNKTTRRFEKVLDKGT